MRYVVLVALFSLFSVFFAAAQEAESAVDRSGEAALLELIATYSSPRSLVVEIERTSRAREADDPTLNGTFRVWRNADGAFRTHYSAYFGSGSVSISDGKTFLYDRLNQAPVELKDAADTIPANHDQLAARRNGSFVLFLMNGPDALTSLVEADAAITLDEEGMIRFEAEWGDQVRIATEMVNNERRLVWVELSTPGRNPNAPLSLTRDEVVVQSFGEDLESWLFLPEPDPGHPVQDRRTESDEG